MTLSSDFDIFTPPSPRIIPCEVRFKYGSLVGTNFKSKRNLCQKREYKRCKVVCSFPPLYQSTGIKCLKFSICNFQFSNEAEPLKPFLLKIGRASCRERV